MGRKAGAGGGSTRRPVYNVIPVDLNWIDGGLPDPLDASYFSYEHDEIAEALRSNPNVWAELTNLPIAYAASIRGGVLVSYRPSGSFEAIVRNNRLYARYLGEGSN